MAGTLRRTLFRQTTPAHHHVPYLQLEVRNESGNRPNFGVDGLAAAHGVHVLSLQIPKCNNGGLSTRFRPLQAPLVTRPHLSRGLGGTQAGLPSRARTRPRRRVRRDIEEKSRATAKETPAGRSVADATWLVVITAVSALFLLGSRQCSFHFRPLYYSIRRFSGNW